MLFIQFRKIFNFLCCSTNAGTIITNYFDSNYYEKNKNVMRKASVNSFIPISLVSVETIKKNF